MKKYIIKAKYLEERLTKTLNGHSNNPLYRILFIFTEAGSSLGVAVMFFIILILTGLKPLFIMIPIYVIQLLIVELIKYVFKRPRPQSFIQENKNLFGIRTTSGSFPSGHTSNAFCMAFLISSYYDFTPFWTIIIYFIAVGVGISRIYLGKHYIIDVIGGALIGLFISVIAWSLIYQP